MSPLDFGVIAAYLLIVLIIGFVVKRRSGGSKNEYLLGGKKLPYWMLGVSNASGMFDISGTIWMVSIMFVYGVKSIWLVWLWPVFNQVFMFAYMSVWLRRSNVSTGAEWILFRFGKGKDAQLSHKIIIAFALLSCFGFMAYGFVGLGKFIEIFIPIEYLQPYLPFTVAPTFVPHFYGIIFTLFAVFYAIMGGMTSIVWADVVQYLLMTVGSISIAVIAMKELSGSSLNVPDEWSNLFFGWNLDLDWSNILPEVNRKITEDKYTPFGMFFVLMATKGILASLAGPAPNYDMQKVLSAKSPREGALLSMFTNVALLPTRYLMIIGFTVLGILYFNELNIQSPTGELDFERILPAGIAKFAPAGLLGLFLIELMAAFMGTFAGTLNAAQAYIVNDIYVKDIKPDASDKQVLTMNYIVGIVVMIVSIALGIYAKDVNSVLQWLVGALYGGYVAANVLKWHWWRFNGNGFFWGMLTGILSAMILPQLLPDALPLYYFPVILLLSAIGSVVGTLVTPPTDVKVLKNFYKTTQPWGFWKPIDALVKQDDPNFVENRNFKVDAFNVVVGTIAQTAITALPVFIVLMKPTNAAFSGMVLAVCVVILWQTWYKKLPKD
jgi:SSS family solute:Na+ symporter